MQGSIDQLAALTLAGNGNENMSRTADFWRDASAFRFCKYVRFISSEIKEESPAAWFTTVRKAGRLRGYKIIYLPTSTALSPDYMTVAFVGGGGKWMIETLADSGSQVWLADWQLLDRSDPERRIWGVTYRQVIDERAEKDTPVPSLAIIRDEIRGTLREILKFAEAHEEKASFASFFKKGIETLDAPKPEPPSYEADFHIFGNLSPLAQQVLYSAMQAWCFGGMSWRNDGGFADADTQAEYLRVTEKLWNTLTLGVLASVNSTFPA